MTVLCPHCNRYWYKTVDWQVCPNCNRKCSTGGKHVKHIIYPLMSSTLMLAASQPKHPSQCIVVDSLTVSAAHQQWTITGHNQCSEPIKSLHEYTPMTIEVKFYNSAGERLGFETVYVGTLGPGEKFRSTEPINVNITRSGVAVSALVSKIE